MLGHGVSTTPRAAFAPMPGAISEGGGRCGEARTTKRRQQNEMGGPLTTEAGPARAIVIAQDITDRVLGREELRGRLAQQAAVSTLGSLTLRAGRSPSCSTRPHGRSTRRSRAT